MRDRPTHSGHSTTDVLLQVRRITSTLNRDLGYRIIDVAKIAAAQLQASSTDVLLQPVQLRRSRNRNDPPLLSQQPGECDLSGRRLLATGNLSEQVDESLIRLARFRCEARNDVAKVATVERRAFANRTC
jgi:hypothetical protein